MNILPKSLRIISDGTPCGTRILDERGDEVKLAVTALVWSHSASKLPSVTLSIEAMLVPTDAGGQAFYETINPATGKWEKIAAIRFADGTEWSAS